MSDTANKRECPECGNLIPAVAIKCKYCDAVVEPLVDPEVIAEHKRHPKEENQVEVPTVEEKKPPVQEVTPPVHEVVPPPVQEVIPPPVQEPIKKTPEVAEPAQKITVNVNSHNAGEAAAGAAGAVAAGKAVRQSGTEGMVLLISALACIGSFFLPFFSMGSMMGTGGGESLSGLTLLQYMGDLLPMAKYLPLADAWPIYLLFSLPFLFLITGVILLLRYLGISGKSAGLNIVVLLPLIVTIVLLVKAAADGGDVGQFFTSMGFGYWIGFAGMIVGVFFVSAIAKAVKSK